MSWVLTKSGNRVDLFDPKPEQIKLHDLAFALSHLNRFCGNAGGYSVAQHSVLVAAHVPDNLILEALLHDAAEAYIGDIVGPLKAQLSGIHEIEGRLHQAISIKFGCGHIIPPEVKRADLIMLATERRDLLPAHEDAWECLEGITPCEHKIVPWPPTVAAGTWAQLVIGAHFQRALVLVNGAGPASPNEVN